jgi:hypothetical protein
VASIQFQDKSIMLFIKWLASYLEFKLIKIHIFLAIKNIGWFNDFKRMSQPKFMIIYNIFS